MLVGWGGGEAGIDSVSVKVSFNCMFCLLISVWGISHMYLIFDFSFQYIRFSLFSLLCRTHVLLYAEQT
jgi:hypothetical protein